MGKGFVMSYKLRRIGILHVDEQVIAYRRNPGHLPYVDICPRGKFYSWCKELMLRYPKQDGWKLVCIHDEKLEAYIQNYLKCIKIARLKAIESKVN